MLQKRWTILPHDAEKANRLRDALGISPVLCNMLVQRGIADFEEAKNYFRPTRLMLHSPWLMKDMDKAVKRILSAIENNESILVFGDYDVDGTTSVALMYQFLCSIYDTEKLEFYIPHRYTEGYGVSRKGIDHAKKQQHSLIVCLDCGIKSADLIAYAKSISIDFIVCDHHLPGDVLPDACAILNAKQPDCQYPFKELCGCGVGFKLASALAEKLNLPAEHIDYYLDLVATAIAADIVSMTGENRVLAYLGLQRINESPCPGIKALIQLAAVNSPLHITNVVFAIAPRVNAAGRMDDARKAVQLFIEKDFEKALEFAEMLHSDNVERRDADATITEQALEMIAGNLNFTHRKSSVVYQEGWHKGVVGIVASRLIERYHRPTVVLTSSGGLVAGSARSIPGFNLYEAIYQCRELLLAYGGHFAAAGLSMLPENVEPFSKLFEEVVSGSIDEQLLIPEIKIDTSIRFPEIKQNLYNIICQMEPFGPDNMRPTFIALNVNETGYSKIVKEKHLRVVLRQDQTTFTGIGFNMAEKFTLLQTRKPVDIVFTLDENEWDGNKSIQLKLIDMRLSESCPQS